MQLTKTNYVDLAEEAVKKLEKNRYGDFVLTTSKIRNILSMVTVIYQSAAHTNCEKLDEDLVEKIQYLRMRIAYEAGRDKAVKNLVEVAKIQEAVKKIGADKEKCIIFCKYMESLVAYHKFYGGRD